MLAIAGQLHSLKIELIEEVIDKIREERDWIWRRWGNEFGEEQLIEALEQEIEETAGSHQSHQLNVHI